MDGQHLKGSDTLLKSPRQYFCHIYRSIWNEVSSTNSILVVSEILRLFVHILTPDEKYSLSVKASVERNQLKWIYVKIKKIFSIFSCNSRICIKFGILWKTRWPSVVNCFQNYRLEKAGLLKCLKRPVSEHLCIVNVLKGPKDCLNLQGSIFVIFFDPSERKSAQKILF